MAAESSASSLVIVADHGGELFSQEMSLEPLMQQEPVNLRALFAAGSEGALTRLQLFSREISIFWETGAVPPTL